MLETVSRTPNRPKMTQQKHNCVLSKINTFCDKKLHGGHGIRNQVQNPAHVLFYVYVSADTPNSPRVGSGAACFGHVSFQEKLENNICHFTLVWTRGAVRPLKGDFQIEKLTNIEGYKHPGFAEEDLRAGGF